jgi:hypothetical protein
MRARRISMRGAPSSAAYVDCVSLTASVRPHLWVLLLRCGARFYLTPQRRYWTGFSLGSTELKRRQA